MQKKYTKLLLNLAIAISLIACSSTTVPQDVRPYYSNELGDYAYCNQESCPLVTRFTLDDEEEYKPIYMESPVVVRDKTITKIVVHYDFSKSFLHKIDQDKIKQVVSKYKNQIDSVAIIGFTDNVEGRYKTFNNGLSKRRAEVVRAYLIKLGVKASDITYQGKPLCCYVSTNKTKKGRAINRRAELQIIIKD